MKSVRTMLLSATLLSLAGCATEHQSIAINDARSQLVAAQHSEEGQRVPAELLVAQRTLEEAQRAHQDEPDSQQVKDLAYIADRQTRLALAHGRNLALAEEAERNRTQYQHDLESSNRNTHEQLEQTQAALTQSDVQRANTATTLARTAEQLEAERRARIAAEARAAEAMTRLQALASVREQNNETVVTILGALLFRSNGSTLLPGAQDRLTAVANVLAAEPDRTVTIEGYTDSTGTQTLNQELSRARAESVRTFMIDHGVAAERIRAVGRGPENPVAENTTAEGRANNRRVEIRLSARPSAAVAAQ